MSSPVTKRRNTRRNVVDSEEESELDMAIGSPKNNALQLATDNDELEDDADVSMLDKENARSSTKRVSVSPMDGLKERRSSLALIDQNVELKLTNSIKLEPTNTTELPVPQSPKMKPSFNGSDMIQISPIKSQKSHAHVLQEKKEPVTRLVINKLVLNNFKSYAGQQIIGPFHPSFSAVVGPNGSGKSNVIDSMLFVFGFRANKMRQGKLSELIHNSEAAPNLQSCSVDIHFLHVTSNLDDTTAEVPGSELVITRRAFKNNSSKYYINGKESNYTEVTTLLKDKGIDLDHKRFLILQGEVESIAQMKAKAEKENDDGLLEYLEDIIGTSNYKSTIEEFSKKIEYLNEICQEKESRFTIVEKEKNSLESRKDEALEFLAKEKELIEKKSLFYQYKAFKATENIHTNGIVLKELQDKLNFEKTESSEFQEEAKTIEKEYNDLLELIERNQTQIKKLKDEQKKGDREKVAVEERKKSLETKRKKNEKLLNTAINAFNEAESKLKNFTEENEQYASELEKLKHSLIKEKATLDEIRAELTNKTKGFNEEIAIYEKKLQPWSDRLEQKKSEITIAESQVQILQEKRIKLNDEMTSIKDRINEIEGESHSNEESIKLLKEEYVHNTEQIKLGEQECSHAERKLAEMNKVLSNHRQKTLEARSSLSTVENKNKVLAGLMRLQETGRIEGFYGRLGDLGYIDDKYDGAISTACGQLDDMVVETVEVGQQCIEYLRKNNLGYSRFILLTKLRKFNLNRIQTPNNVPRLFDLVQPKDPKFAPAFYSVLQDTLVASNLSEANQVAYGAKRFRVVTLDGKLIDKSGTLSGGGNTVSKGGMKSTSQAGQISEKEVLQLEKELNQKEHNYEIAQNTFYEMTDALKQLKERQPEIESLISKHEFEIESATNESKNAKTRLKELQKASEVLNTNNKEISETEDKVKSLISEYEQLQDQSKEIQNKINELQENIMQIGGVKLRSQSSTVDSINQKIDIATDKMKHNRVAVKKVENELKRYINSKVEKQQEITDIEVELSKIGEDFQKKMKAFENIELQLNELMMLKDENTYKSETLKNTLDEKLEKINDLRSAEIELENKIERHQGLIKQEKQRLKDYTEVLNSLEITDLSELLSFLEDEEIISKYTKPLISELSSDEIQGLDINAIESKIEELENFITKSKVNTDILEEFGKRAVEYNSRKTDLNDAVQQRDKIKKMSEELKKRRLDEFMEGFNIISGTLKEMYQMITMGGNAELELVDSLDPFSEGILFSVMPPKKSWKNISNLSGGEKTLSSLALVFALHRYKPTPLYVMDEIDAALDFRNVSIVANYIKERTKNAQFVVISLRNNMFELAQQLVGIYKVNNMTRSITLQNRDMLTTE